MVTAAAPAVCAVLSPGVKVEEAVTLVPRRRSLSLTLSLPPPPTPPRESAGLAASRVYKQAKVSAKCHSFSLCFLFVCRFTIV